MFWNLRQLAGALTAVSEAEPLVEALNGFSAAYRAALAAAMVRRLGLDPPGREADVDLVNAAFRALAEGGERLRWEPFFFDWFGGDEVAGDGRAPGRPLRRRGLRRRSGHLDGDPRARTVRSGYTHEYFQRTEPEELLYDQIESLWIAVADRDDWSPFTAKLAAIETAREGLGVSK